MNKKLLILAITAILALAPLLSLASASYSGYYYPPHPSYGSYSGYGNYYAGDSYSQTSYYTNRQSSINYYSWGAERVTTYTNQKITVDRMYNPPMYYPRYFNTYTTPYYYAPRYDTYQGHYNWRY